MAGQAGRTAGGIPESAWVQGEYGKSLLRRRGELLERSFAHCYDTGGMRRTHLRGHENILKRQLIHVGAFNLSLILLHLLHKSLKCLREPQFRGRAGDFPFESSGMRRKDLYSPGQHAPGRKAPPNAVNTE